VTTHRPRFAFCQQLQELKALADWAKVRLDATSHRRIDEVCQNFEAFQTSKAPKYRLHVPCDRPICTQPTRAYEPGGKAPMVVGRLSFTVDMFVVDTGKKRTQFELGSETTYYVDLVDQAGRPLAVWHHDVVAPDGPGALLHAQIPGRIPIPRLPSLCLLPGDALEFLMAELFHHDWSEVGQGEKYARFANLQRPRLMRVLHEQHRALQASSRESGWSVLRRWRPVTALDFSA
jgi:hypothetical protein